MQKVMIFEKKSVYQLDLNPQVGCGFQWNVALVFPTSSSSTHCRTQSDPALTRGDKLEVGG